MSGVLVVMEAASVQRGGGLNRMSLEALAAGVALAEKLGSECSAALLGAELKDVAANVGGRITKLYMVEHALLAQYTADGYVTALEQLIRKLEPAYVLVALTRIRFATLRLAVWRLASNRC